MNIHAGPGILNFAIVLQIDNFLAGHLHQVAGKAADVLLAKRTAFDGEAREVSAELVILSLRPFLERMIVALVAVEADTQERLTYVLGDLAWITQGPVVVHFGIQIRTSFGEQQLADEFIVRLVPRQGVFDPVVEHPNALLAQMLAVTL